MKGIKFDHGGKFHICKSDIDGRGIIASQNLKKGELIGAAVDNEEMVKGEGGVYRDTRTRLGRTLNHQDKENAIQKSEKGALNIYAKNDIKDGDEITLNYKNSPNYIDKNVEGYKT